MDSVSLHKLLFIIKSHNFQIFSHKGGSQRPVQICWDKPHLETMAELDGTCQRLSPPRSAIHVGTPKDTQENDDQG